MKYEITKIANGWLACTAHLNFGSPPLPETYAATIEAALAVIRSHAFETTAIEAYTPKLALAKNRS